MRSSSQWAGLCSLSEEMWAAAVLSDNMSSKPWSEAWKASCLAGRRSADYMGTGLSWPYAGTVEIKPLGLQSLLLFSVQFWHSHIMGWFGFLHCILGGSEYWQSKVILTLKHCLNKEQFPILVLVLDWYKFSGLWVWVSDLVLAQLQNSKSHWDFSSQCCTECQLSIQTVWKERETFPWSFLTSLLSKAFVLDLAVFIFAVGLPA